ncbi:hypothetical protein CTAYLR_002295 [Chrysophaeum taylorii]|uniref:JmjC domain-containing protein n=1 Tax=Chrysophaeum taylorii TaxID=2483200 RepID=A0AAD7XQ87_9STRA|nr:hypothetical protein CTAYLR_002295 [Chrysophaeum taylorii]
MGHKFNGNGVWMKLDPCEGRAEAVGPATGHHKARLTIDFGELNPAEGEENRRSRRRVTSRELKKVAGGARAILHGGTQESECVLFENPRDVVLLEPPVSVQDETPGFWVLSCEVKLRPVSSASEERWLVVCYSKPGDSSHVCVLAQRGRQVLGVWCGASQRWSPCSPFCELSGLAAKREWIDVRARGSWVSGDDPGRTTFWINGVMVGTAPLAIRLPICGLGNVAPEGRLDRMQVVGRLRRLELRAGGLDVEAPAETPWSSPGQHPDFASVMRSRALSPHGEEEAFATAVSNAKRGNAIWVPYSAVETAAERVRHFAIDEARHACAFKFRSEVFELGPPGPELERLARAAGASAAMRELMSSTQMSTLFAPAGRDPSGVGGQGTSLDFKAFVAAATECDRVRPVGDKDDVATLAERASVVGLWSNAPKVTEWKPDWLRSSGEPRLGTPRAWDPANWLTHLELRRRHVFRPKLAMMLSGALTAHHRDNFGAWTWIKVIGGEQLFACWSMADGDASDRLRDRDDDDENEDQRFDWAAFVALPSARLVVLRAGDFFLLRPGTYHRVLTLQTKLQLFGEFIWGESFLDSLESVIADSQRPSCLHACDTTISMTDVFYVGLVSEINAAVLRATGEDRKHLRKALQILHCSTGTRDRRAKLQALRWVHPDCMAVIVRYLRLDVDTACQHLVHLQI